MDILYRSAFELADAFKSGELTTNVVLELFRAQARRQRGESGDVREIERPPALAARRLRAISLEIRGLALVVEVPMDNGGAVFREAVTEPVL